MKWWPFRQQEKQGAGVSLSGDSPPPSLQQSPLADLARFFRWATPRASAEVAVVTPVPNTTLPRVKGLRDLPRPALRWVGETRRIALREFSFEDDMETICSFQDETYALNFPDFHYTRGFAQAFRHDLRRASLDHHHGLFVLDERRENAEDKNTLAGFLWLVVCENNWTGERYGYINNVYLVPERRGQGLGQEMMRHADDFFRARGVRRVRLTVTASNAEAARLYERAGYRVTRWEMDKEL
jgi:ribosomal protein S18 acetylase RimI-like enzyme